MTEFETMKIAFDRIIKEFYIIKRRDGSAIIELATPEGTAEFLFNTTGELEHIFYC